MDSPEITSFIRKLLEIHVALVAVSKTQSADAIKHVYDCGQRVFGENRVQELVRKHQELPEDIQWHMVGHLQTNKVKFIVPFVKLIHSADNYKLIAEIDKEAAKINRVVDCLLEIKIAKEDSKFGLSIENARLLLNEIKNGHFEYMRIRGLMGIASNTNNETEIRKEFSTLNQFFLEIKSQSDFACFDILSMGMSGDYNIAIEEGSNMIRVGSAIFGKRI